jgi:hypothetical protein
LQYYTGIAGNFKSFNYQGGVTTAGQFLANQNFNICFRQEEGNSKIIQSIHSTEIYFQSVIYVQNNFFIFILGFCSINYRQNDATTVPGFQLDATAMGASAVI